MEQPTEFELKLADLCATEIASMTSVDPSKLSNIIAALSHSLGYVIAIAAAGQAAKAKIIATTTVMAMMASIHSKLTAGAETVELFKVRTAENNSRKDFN